LLKTDPIKTRLFVLDLDALSGHSETRAR